MITLRLGERHSRPDEAKALVEALQRHPGSCDTVWFSTLYGYPPMEVHAAKAAEIAEAAKIYAENGIGVSIQIANTLGHGEYMKSKNCRGLVYDGSPAENIVGPNGEVARYCFCWRGKHFREYTMEELKLYAAMEPEVVWYDDDLCADEKSPARFSCYCDNCIAGFNALYGSNFTRETLVHEINYGDITWRLRYIEYCRNGISDFVEEMTRTIKAVSPKTKFGMQHAHWCNYMGADDHFIMDAIHRASGEPAQSRPGGSYYGDKQPLDQFAKSMRLACTMSRLRDEVKDRKAEVENLPDVVYGKSIGGTIAESTMHLICGCTGLTYACIMRNHEPMAWHEKMFARYSQIRPYWEKLSHVSKTAHCGGVRIFRADHGHHKVLKSEDEPFSWIDIIYENNTKLMIDGIPVTHDQHGNGAYLLHYQMIPHMTGEDIRYLLTQPVLTDAASVKAIMDRGFGDCFRLTLEPKPNVPYVERFNAHPVNGDHAGWRFSESSFFFVDMPKYIIRCEDAGTETIGEYVQVRTGEVPGSSAVLTQVYQPDGTLGGKWAVFGYCLWNDVISSAKRDQILHAADAIQTLPAMLVSNDQAAVVPAVNDQGQTVAVSVASASIGGSEELELLIRNPASKNLTVMNTRCVAQEPLAVEEREDGLYVKLAGLQPYEIVTVFF